MASGVILVDTSPRVGAGFPESVAEDDFTVVNLEPADDTRAGEPVVRYADLPVWAVDASVIAIAERLEVTEVATLDRRHFTVVRPRGIGPLVLLPE